MDPEFQRVMLRVLMVGGTMATIGLIAVIVAFRAYGEKKDPAKRVSPFLILMIAVALILVCCVVLLIFSTPRTG